MEVTHEMPYESSSLKSTPPGDDHRKITDVEILGLVHESLHGSGYGHLRTLNAYCENGRVTLQGRVPTYYLKQVAQSVVLTVTGVRDIDNDIRVHGSR